MSLAWRVFVKELVDALRDRRTLLMMIGLPVLVYPLLMMGLSRLQESQEAATEARRSVAAIVPCCCCWHASGCAPARSCGCCSTTSIGTRVT